MLEGMRRTEKVPVYLLITINILSSIPDIQAELSCLHDCGLLQLCVMDELHVYVQCLL